MFEEIEIEINEVNNPSHALTKVGTTTISSVSNLNTDEALKAHYGEMTDFTSISGVQWQLFYDDAEYCYVIASDISNNSFNQKYLQWPLQEANRGKDFLSLRATALMMDTSKWSNFTGTTGLFAVQ